MPKTTTSAGRPLRVCALVCALVAALAPGPVEAERGPVARWWTAVREYARGIAGPKTHWHGGLKRYRPGDAPAVVVVHGLAANAGVMRPIVSALRRAGVRSVATVNYKIGREPIDTILARIDSVVREARAAGHPRVRLVGHSLGGALSGVYLQRYAPPSDLLVTMGSPLQSPQRSRSRRGRLVARVLRGAEHLAHRLAPLLRRIGYGALPENLAQMSDVEQTSQLRALTDGSRHTRVVSFVGDRDMIVPNGLSAVTWPRNVGVSVSTGHVGLLSHDYVLDELGALLGSAPSYAGGEDRPPARSSR